MNNSNIRFLSFASLTLFLGLVPLACGDDDGDSPGTSGTGGTSTAGKANNGGDDTGGTSNGGTSNGGTNNAGNGGSLNIGGDDNGVGGGEGGVGGEGAVAKSRLRVVHASPNAPAVDIYVAGTTTAAVENLAYGKATQFLEVDAGTISFDLRAEGTASSEDPAFTSEDITLEGGQDYTLVAAGELGSEDEEVSFRILPIQHDFEAAEAGVAQVSVVHATSAWEDVSLDLASTVGVVDLEGLTRFGSETVALPTTAADDISFWNAEDEVVSQLVLPKLVSKSEVFVIATGNPGFPFRAPANGFALLVVNSDGTTSWVKENPWIHVLHSSDVGTVDLYTSAAPTVRLADDVAQGALSAFQVGANTAGYTLKAVDSAAANGSVTSDAQGATSTLLVGEHYLSYLAGDQIRTIREQFDLTQTEKVLLRGVHGVKAGVVTASVDFGPANVGVTALTSAVVTGVLPGQASSPVTGDAIDPGAVTLGVTATGTLTPLVASLALTGTATTPAAPIAGERDFVLVTGAAANAAKIYVVDTSVAGWSVR